MKNIFLLTISILTSVIYAQTDVNLEISHTLGNESAVLNTATANNLNHNFKLTRLQYYVSRISIVHDGGTVTSVNDDVIAIINVAEEEELSTIELGSQTFTEIEAVKFHIGVYDPINNEDPAQWPAGHPLAPQNPSMHWGWASGYRFAAIEGNAGNNFSQNIQFHGLGNANYFETTVDVNSVLVNGVETIRITADYVETLTNIALNNGVISHGETGEARDVLLNFFDGVFSANTSVLSISSENLTSTLEVFPNPTTGELKINVNNIENPSIRITNSLGTLIQAKNLSVSSTNIVELQAGSGVYFVSLYSDRNIVSTKRIIKK